MFDHDCYEDIVIWRRVYLGVCFVDDRPWPAVCIGLACCAFFSFFYIRERLVGLAGGKKERTLGS